MRVLARFLPLAAAVALGLATSGAAAAVVVTGETKLGGGAVMPSTIYLEPGKLRIESAREVTIFRADQNAVTVLMPTDKTFTRITPQAMRQGAQALDAARAQLQEQMRSMPEAQRKQIEQMMAQSGMNATGQPTKVDYRRTGARKKFGRWDCDEVEQIVNGRSQAKMCVARLSDLGVTSDDIGIFRRFVEFMQQGAEGRGGMVAASWDVEAIDRTVGYQGFPVHTEIGTPSGPIETSTKSVERREPPAGSYDVPPGYRETDPMARASGPPGAAPRR